MKIHSLILNTVLIALCAFSHSQAQPADTTGKISGDVDISFRTERLSAKLAYSYIATEDAETTLVFYLGGEFDVKQIRCAACSSSKFNKTAKPLPSLIFELKKPLARGKGIKFEVEYEGSIKDIYNREQKFLELGLDNFWFPIHKSFGGINFVYLISVKTDEENFVLAANGKVSKKSKSWSVRSKVPDFDIDLVFGDGLKVDSYTRDNYDLRVVSKNLPDGVSSAMLANIRETLEFYNSTFGVGDRQMAVTAVIRPHITSEGQGGYFRKGYFVIPKTDNAQSSAFTVAHELAHYWWLSAGQQNAWLNESFAEYSAMLAIRKAQGTEAFNKILDEKRKNSQDLPPVYGFDRTKNRQQTVAMLYRKGVVKLGDLEAEIGEQKFMEFLSRAAAAKIDTTDKLIELLAVVTTRETADRFLAKLKE